MDVEGNIIQSIDQRNKTLQITLGYSCNNNCSFCTEDRNNRAAKKNTPIEFYKKIIKDSAKKFKTIIFTHGEPTLNKNLPELIRYAKEFSYPRISLVTNGRMLSYKSFCSKLAKSGLNEICFSVHGHNPELHDNLTRSPGSFKQACMGMANIQRFRKKGIIKQFTIHATIVKQNYKFLKEMYGFFNSFGPDRIIFNMFNPKNADSKKIDSHMAKYSDIVNVIKGFYFRGESNFVLIDFPSCTAGDMIHNMGSISDSHIKELNCETKCKEFKRAALEGKIKLKDCGKCKFGSVCPGISEEYIKKFGTGEFKPVK